MRITECLDPLAGAWRGINRLRLLPTDDYQESAATVKVGVTAREYVTLAYTWADGDQPQDGLLLLAGGADAAPDAVTAVWVDSWHAAPAWMSFDGTIGDDGVVRLIGSYGAPSGPDWGWHIHIEPDPRGGGRITMHNVMPGAPPYQVVELVADRAFAEPE